MQALHMSVYAASSEAHKRLDPIVAATRQALVEPGLILIIIGLSLTLIPPLIIMLAPLMLLLFPALLPLGFTLALIGMSRVAFAVGFSRRQPKRPSPPKFSHHPKLADRPADGTLAALERVTTQRGEALVHQVAGVIRSNVGNAVHDLRNEMSHQLGALQGELQSWVSSNPNLSPYSEGRIGWLARTQSREDAAELDCTSRFRHMYGGLPPAHEVLTTASLELLPLPERLMVAGAVAGWQSLHYLLVPGLLTKWYPAYMAQLLADLKRLGLHATFSAVDTDRPVRENAGRLQTEILELASAEVGPRRVVLLCHSKGGCDAAAALALFPELIPLIAAVVTVQAPHSGSAIAHDLANTDLQLSVAVSALERLLRGSRHAVLDLSYDNRQAFLEQHPYPSDAVPTLCVASCEKRPSSLLKPTIDYLALRYGEWSDGCVCQADATLPGCRAVFIEDMDHFGPAWRSLPATDPYDPARLWLTCASIAMCESSQRESAIEWVT